MAAPTEKQSSSPASSCKSPVGIIYNAITAASYVKGCGKWACAPCGRKNAKRLMARCAGVEFTYFLHLTADPGTTKDVEVKRFNAQWRGFYQWLKRNCEVGERVWCNERGSKTGHLHKHVAIRATRFSYGGARKALARTGLGRVCAFKRLRYSKRQRQERNFSGGPSYVVKYLTKDNSRFPHYARRFQCSVKNKPRPVSQDKWNFVRTCVSDRTWSKLPMARGVVAHVLGCTDDAVKRAGLIRLARFLFDSHPVSLFTMSDDCPVWSAPLTLRIGEKLHHGDLQSLVETGFG